MSYYLEVGELSSEDEPRVMVLLQRSIFTISIDFELLWGYILHPEDRAVGLLRGDPSRGRQSTLELLRILDRHHIPATWATVGGLFLEPGEMKELAEVRVFGDCDQRLLHAPDLVDIVRSSPVGHEIGYHSLTHPRFSECTSARAWRELDEGVRLGAERGLELRSFVFPENRIGHIDLLGRAGFRIVRGRNLGGRGVERGVSERLKGVVMRRITAPEVAVVWRHGVWEVPGSMLFGDPLVPAAVAPRAIRGLDNAIRSQQIFHVWLHPQDLLLDRGLGTRLDEFLGYVSRRRSQGVLDVITMGQLADHLSPGARESVSEQPAAVGPSDAATPERAA